MRKYLKIIFALTLTALFFVACSSSESGGDSKSENENKTAATSAPQISFAAFDLNGQQHTYQQYAGKPLIVNFWGTWCPPCKREMPDLQRIYNEYGPKGLEIIGLAVERNPNDVERVRNFVNQFGYDWVMLMANIDAKRSLGMGSGVPYTLFVDREGNVIHKHTGWMSYDMFKTQVEKII